MVPVVSSEPEEEDCIQSPEKEVVKPDVESSDTVNEPEPNATDWLSQLLREKDDG